MSVDLRPRLRNIDRCVYRLCESLALPVFGASVNDLGLGRGPNSKYRLPLLAPKQLLPPSETETEVQG